MRFEECKWCICSTCKLVKDTCDVCVGCYVHQPGEVKACGSYQPKEDTSGKS